MAAGETIVRTRILKAILKATAISPLFPMQVHGAIALLLQYKNTELRWRRTVDRVNFIDYPRLLEGIITLIFLSVTLDPLASKSSPNKG